MNVLGVSVGISKHSTPLKVLLLKFGVSNGSG